MGLWDFTDGTIFEFLDIFENAGAILGDVQYVIALLLGLTAFIIWALDDTHGYALTGYLIIIGGFGTVVLSQLAIFFVVILAMGIGMMFYKLYETR